MFTGGGITHAQNFPGCHPPPLPLVVLGGKVCIAWRRVYVTQSNCRRVNISACMRGWGAALGSVTRGNLGSQKPAGIWLVKVPGVKQPAIGVVAVAAANFSTVCGLVFLEGMTLMLASFNGQQRHELPAEASPRISSDV